MEIKIVDIIYASFLIEIGFVRCHKIRNKRFEKMENQEITSGDVVELQGSVKENIMCLVKCTEREDCSAVAISKTSKRCVLLLEMLCQTLFSENYQWDVYRVATDWQLVFRGTAGINIPLVSTWTGLTPTTNPIECKNVTSTACGAHYRSPMIDSWSSCGVKQAKVELYEGGTSVAMVIFDAVGSDSLSWFSLPRVLESTWNIKKSDTFDKFQLIGNGHRRTFYISQHRNCPNDRGFLIAVDLGTKTYCSYEVMSSYPQFLYSTTRDKVIWLTKEYGMADALTVYVRLT